MAQDIDDVDLKAAVEAGEKEPKIEVTWTPEQLEEAKAMGYNDDPERLPEGKKFVGPVDYMERNPLYKKVKAMESTLSSVMAHNEKVNASNLKKAEADYKTQIDSLMAEKVQALDDDDHKKVVAIDEEIRTTEKPEKQVDNTILQDWVKDNPWYDDDSFLKVEATRIGEILYSETLFGRPLLDAVKEHLKQAHPDRFKNPNRKKPASVEGGGNGNAPSVDKASAKDLTAEETVQYRNWKNMGIFKEKGAEQKYLNDVIEMRG